MPDIAANNKRIAKNTILLYVRMILVTLVTLYTTRIILKALGVVDYGIYNVIGGVIAFLGIFNSSVSAATQRYLSFDIGNGDGNSLNKDFSACLNIYIALSVIVIIIAETIGLWFVNTQLNIPADRLLAANYVYQFTIFSSICSLLWAPFTASIISHERMDAFAWISIIEVSIRLILAYAVLYIGYDHLIVYSFFLFLSFVIVALCYISFCYKHFNECRIRLFYEKERYNKLISYSGWNIFGSAAGLIANQGVNILLNIFYGPAVNAARGIAFQVSGAITQFFANFYTAVKPQVVKYYATKDFSEMYNLVCYSARFSYYLALLIAAPVFFELSYIVQLWLGETPNFLIVFGRLAIIYCVLESFSNPLMTTVLAAENIKGYQIAISFINLMTFPIAYICLKIFQTPTIVFVVSIFISIVANIGRAYYAQKLVGLKMTKFLKEVVFKISIPTVLVPIVPQLILISMNEGLSRLCMSVIITLISSSIIIYFVGMNHKERDIVIAYVKKAKSQITRKL
ncbi:oligosaccharide flippase family protein [Prevotella sp. KH2C16]|uniref:oligosaccharide flippase family protein n=1 Tax=Prevotella sp. KH2C16 TaxID=1855325 RepID=UPI0008F3E596|nr:oligosaccharide flippase family protein [Prevotella sp. KH2C16]SFG53285.1 Na+-driven multidrug efflux pump [Prevotella sp. KH2C16]